MMSNVDHVDFLREESAIVLSDGCPVAAGRLTRAADALEQAWAKIKRLESRGIEDMKDRIEQLEASLREIGRQHLVEEMEHTDGDYEFAYEQMIRLARKVLGSAGEKRSG